MSFSTEEEKISYQGTLLRNRIIKRYRHLKKWAKRYGLEAFRLYDRDIPEIPLVLDLYGNSIAGALFERPYQKTEEAEETWLTAMQEAAASALGIDPGQVFLKRRRRQRGRKQYEKTGAAAFVRDIREGPLRFRVNLSGYLDTGLFLDRRQERALVRSEAAGKKVLNLFCYTGSFSVCAAAGGAVEIDSVDLSKTYLDWVRVNFELNGFTAGGKSPYRLIRGNALSFLDEAIRKKQRWDLIILDPPTFSNSKSMDRFLDLRRDYPGLVGRCLELLSPQGSLYFSANARRVNFDRSAFPQAKVRELPNTDEDFRGKKPPLCYILTCG